MSALLERLRPRRLFIKVLFHAVVLLVSSVAIAGWVERLFLHPNMDFRVQALEHFLSRMGDAQALQRQAPPDWHGSIASTCSWSPSTTWRATFW